MIPANFPKRTPNLLCIALFSTFHCRQQRFTSLHPLFLKAKIFVAAMTVCSRPISYRGQRDRQTDAQTQTHIPISFWFLWCRIIINLLDYVQLSIKTYGLLWIQLLKALIPSYKLHFDWVCPPCAPLGMARCLFLSLQYLSFSFPHLVETSRKPTQKNSELVHGYVDDKLK